MLSLRFVQVLRDQARWPLPLRRAGVPEGFYGHDPHGDGAFQSAAQQVADGLLLDVFIEERRQCASASPLARAPLSDCVVYGAPHPSCYVGRWPHGSHIY